MGKACLSGEEATPQEVASKQPAIAFSLLFWCLPNLES